MPTQSTASPRPSVRLHVSHSLSLLENPRRLFNPNSPAAHAISIPKEAIDVYTQALGMCPDHEDGLVARGAAFATTGRLRQAAQDLSRALSLNPRNENASSYLKETRRCARADRPTILVNMLGLVV